MELKTLFEGIADAIREKDGSQGEITASAFPERIRAIPTGGKVTLERIEITAPPEKTGYFAGERFDAAGMSVWAELSNGYGVYVNHSDLTFDPAGPLEAGTDSVTVRFQWGEQTASAAQAVQVAATQIYGVEWDGTSTTKLTRTDRAAGFADPVPAVDNGDGSSPFDQLQPWAGMVRSSRAGGAMVAIPKFWYKFTKSGTALKLQIADDKVDGFFVSPAHADRGDGKGERDVVYVGRYHCAADTYQSETNKAQMTGVTRSAARTAIHSLGAGIWQFDMAMRLTIQMLYLVEFADWNSQAVIGFGCSPDGVKENNGRTDAMKYCTGTTAASRDAYGHTQYRNIEGLWDNAYNWIDGCYNNDSGVSVILNPEEFDDLANGAVIGVPPGGYVTAFDVAEQDGVQWLVPSGNGGSESTYITDTWGFATYHPCIYGGGSCAQGMSRGIFLVSFHTLKGSDANIGCRLQELP